MEVKLRTRQEMDMSIASGIPRASLSRPGANNRISIQCRLEDIHVVIAAMLGEVRAAGAQIKSSPPPLLPTACNTCLVWAQGAL